MVCISHMKWLSYFHCVHMFTKHVERRSFFLSFFLTSFFNVLWFIYRIWNDSVIFIMPILQSMLEKEVFFLSFFFIFFFIFFYIFFYIFFLSFIVLRVFPWCAQPIKKGLGYPIIKKKSELTTTIGPTVWKLWLIF